MKKLRFLDISGFGASGKGALIDVLREFDDGYYVPHYSFEFALLRIKDGLINLCQDLTENWSPSRSDTALKKFSLMIKKIAYNPHKYNVLGRLGSTGMRYEYYFHGRFLEITNEYLEKLIEIKYHGLSPYTFQNMNPFIYAIKKTLNSLLNKPSLYGEELLISINNVDLFYQYTRDYLNKLFTLLAVPETHTVTLFNACEPYNSSQALNLFHKAQQIIVDRDPRDLYLSTYLDNHLTTLKILYNDDNHATLKKIANIQKLFNDKPGIENFVYRYRILRERTRNINSNIDKRILHIYFEDLVLHYDDTCLKIYTFLGEDSSVHINSKKYFNPEISKKGVGLWKNTNKKNEINYIKQHLPEYCRDY